MSIQLCRSISVGLAKLCSVNTNTAYYSSIYSFSIGVDNYLGRMVTGINRLQDMEGAEMTNQEKYNAQFVEVFEVSESALGPNLLYQSIDAWDSVGHMQLIAALEDVFDIMLDTDDIIDFNSYEKGMELLSKYGVEF